FNLSFVQYSDAGAYSVLVSNSFGSLMSSNAVLTVVPPTPPAFLTSPSNQYVPVGNTFSLASPATGAPPPAYQWYFNGNPLSDDAHYTGAATANLQIFNAQTTDTGNYYAIATNIAGAATSSVATVTVLMPPAITKQPSSQSMLQ